MSKERRFLRGAYLCLFFIIICFRVEGQSAKVNYGVDTNVLLGGNGDVLPFWLYADTDGVVDPASNNWITNIHSTYSSIDTVSTFRYKTGFNLASRVSDHSSTFFTQLYGEVGYGFLNLTVGRFYNPIGMTDDDLSMGSMLVSRNAIPFPKIRLSTDGFTNIPLTQGYLQFKAMISHGWLGNDRYVENPYIHQKYVYLKLNYKFFEGMGGIVHNVVWGGKNHPQYGDLPSSFSDYLRVVTGMGADEYSDAPNGEKTNVIGNSVAGYDFRMNLNFPQFQFHAYRLFFLEDKVSSRFRSPWDGMWGAGVDFIKNQGLITGILWEHINSKRQDSFDFEPRGTASYYNHFIYRSGWSYEHNVIGNPLFIYGPNSNFGSARTISNNIIIAHHFGIKGSPSDRFSYKVFVTYSRNYGIEEDQTQNGERIPLDALRVDEYSTMLKTAYLLSSYYDITLISTIAADFGELYGKGRLGIQLGLKWSASRLVH